MRDWWWAEHLLTPHSGRTPIMDERMLVATENRVTHVKPSTITESLYDHMYLEIVILGLWYLVIGIWSLVLLEDT